MNMWTGTGLVALAAGLIWFFVDQKPADVYDMPVDQAYSLLANVDFGERTEGERAAQISYSSTGNGSDKVVWSSRGSHSRRSCDLQLAPLADDASRTHVTVTCQGGGAGEGAAAGMAHNMFRNRMIERLDATLTGRPYDVSRVGQTSNRWPSDGVDGSYATAVNNAMEMDAEMRRLQAEIEANAPPAIEDYQPSGYDSDGYAY